MTREDGVAVEECRAALNRILDSHVFSGSRRLSEFCDYSGQAAIEGRSEIGQYEIAEKVLGRATDFNPWDDAGVRKLATQVRHKLEEYYAGPGASDPVVLSLPRRSYVLRFRRREADQVFVPSPEMPDVAAATEPASIQASPGAEHAPAAAGHFAKPVITAAAWRWLLLGVVLGALPAATWVFMRGGLFPAQIAEGAHPPDRIVITMQRGDLRGKDLDIAPGAVRVGSVLGEGEETSVRLQLAPEYSTQQAGLMALYDADNYVRVGYHFKNRTLLEFGFEHDGTYEGPQSTYVFDPLGQTGQARWLALRRSGAEYTAYLSPNGFYWNQFGHKLNLPDTSGDLHSAVYAFNGRSTNPSELAVFDHFGTGLAFHDRPDGPFNVAQFPGWTAHENCQTPVLATFGEGVLRVGFAAQAIGCAWSLVRVPPPGDWAISVLVDFEAVSGSSFGVTVRGTKASASLTRRDLDGRSLQLEQNNDRDTRIPDFPGTPPVLLRMQKSEGVIRASVSRDMETFVSLPGEVTIADTGDIRSLGVSASIAHWTTQESRPPVRIYWIRIEQVKPDFLTKRNVP